MSVDVQTLVAGAFAVFVALLAPGLIAWGTIKASVRNLRDECAKLRIDLHELSGAVTNLRVELARARGGT